MKEKTSSYIFGFTDIDGEAYDFHISDNLQSRPTWESIESKFSLPNSKYMIIWKSDGTKFAKKEAQDIVSHVIDELEEFLNKIKSSDNNERNKINSMLTPSKDYLIIAYDRLILPQGNINWKNYADIVSFKIDDMIENSIT